MVKYKLVYFQGKGRAEVARLLFAHAGVDYEDKRIEREEWPALKPSTPTGQLPYLEVDDFKLGQSNAIGRFLAREFSLYGSNSLEAAKIDELVDSVNDLLELGVRWKFADESSKDKALKTLQDKIPVTFKIIEDALEKNGTGWLVGSKPTLADIHTYHCIGMFDLMRPFLPEGKEVSSKLVEHNARVAELPNIKKWLQERPVTEF